MNQSLDHHNPHNNNNTRYHNNRNNNYNNHHHHGGDLSRSIEVEISHKIQQCEEKMMRASQNKFSQLEQQRERIQSQNQKMRDKLGLVEEQRQN